MSGHTQNPDNDNDNDKVYFKYLIIIYESKTYGMINYFREWNLTTLPQIINYEITYPCIGKL